MWSLQISITIRIVPSLLSDMLLMQISILIQNRCMNIGKQWIRAQFNIEFEVNVVIVSGSVCVCVYWRYVYKQAQSENMMASLYVACLNDTAFISFAVGVHFSALFFHHLLFTLVENGKFSLILYFRWFSFFNCHNADTTLFHR